MECELVYVVEESISSNSCLLIAAAKDRRTPLRVGDLKHREGKRRRRSQEAKSLTLDMASKTEASFILARSLEALGILLMILAELLGGREVSDSGRVGRVGLPSSLLGGAGRRGRDDFD